MDPQPSPFWSVPAAQVLKDLQTAPAGLSAAEAASRLERYAARGRRPSASFCRIMSRRLCCCTVNLRRGQNEHRARFTGVSLEAVDTDWRGGLRLRGRRLGEGSRRRSTGMVRWQRTRAPRAWRKGGPRCRSTDRASTRGSPASAAGSPSGLAGIRPSCASSTSWSQCSPSPSRGSSCM